MDLVEAAAIANAVGALSVQQAGATGGLLGWEATRAWADQFRK
jgi:sugar/nucleoside kinase (ribokinase family)